MNIILSAVGAYVALAAALALVLAVWLLLGIALFVRHKAFDSRCDKNPLLKYFSAEDFSLTCEMAEIPFGKDKRVRAALYRDPSVPARDEMVIFCHGMGPGHIAYTTEIAYFCSLGYPVFAPDYIGCNLSDGKNIMDFANGRLTVGAAVDYVRRNLPRFKKIYLVGHSWGGYSAICAGYEKGVDKIVAISAPDRADRALYNAISARLFKPLAVLLKPFLRLFCGDKSAAKLASACKCPVMLVQGDKDAVVPPSNAVYYRAEGEHITKFLCEGKGHNPYNTPEGEQKLALLSEALASASERGEEYFRDFDYAAATEEDGEVMGGIARFLA